MMNMYGALGSMMNAQFISDLSMKFFYVKLLILIVREKMLSPPQAPGPNPRRATASPGTDPVRPQLRLSPAASPYAAASAK
jgi:hypothetical protein